MSDRDSLLALVDTKLMLGYRYQERAGCSPSIADANALAGMAAGEFGQGYHLMDALEDLGMSVAALERRRSPGEYSSIDVLDRRPQDWGEFLAACGLADTATVVRLGTLATGAPGSVADLARKATQEEEFHRLYLTGACESYSARERLRGSLQRLLPQALRWFGSGDGAAIERETLLERLGGLCGEPSSWAAGPDALDWGDWDERRLRSSATSPPADAVAALALEELESGIGQRCLDCGSSDVERLTDFGASDMTMQLRCRRCRTIFEAVKWA